MLKQGVGEQLQAAVLAGMKFGHVSVPYMLLRMYREWKLTELDVMVLIQLFGFTVNERKDFPTIEEIQARLSAPADHVIQSLQKLLKDQWIAIEEKVDPLSKMQYEQYNLDGVERKIARYWVDSRESKMQADKNPPQGGKDIYSVIEQEFGRPLTPMELEMITNWLDNDHFKEPLIMAALKEAVFAGKVHFNYIDRILLEWSRNQVFTVEQAKEHAKKFRRSR